MDKKLMAIGQMTVDIGKTMLIGATADYDESQRKVRFTRAFIGTLRHLLAIDDVLDVDTYSRLVTLMELMLPAVYADLLIDYAKDPQIVRDMFSRAGFSEDQFDLFYKFCVRFESLNCE